MFNAVLQTKALTRSQYRGATGLGTFLLEPRYTDEQLTFIYANRI
jgi:hypothetical protein